LLQSFFSLPQSFILPFCLLPSNQVFLALISHRLSEFALLIELSASLIHAFSLPQFFFLVPQFLFIFQ
jgi:predicted ATPase